MSDFSALRYVDQLPRTEKIARLIWEIVWPLVFRPTPRWALHSWRRMLLRAFGAKVGVGCRIDPTCFVWAPWKLALGDFVALGPGVDCYSMDHIRIGSKTTISQRSFICTGTHDVASLLRPLVTKPVTIGSNCWLAAECMLMPGVEIGDGAVIGARSVVTRSMPSWTICAGHPCVPIKNRYINMDEQDLLNYVEGRPVGVAL